MSKKAPTKATQPKGPNHMMVLVKKYKWFFLSLFVLSIIANGFSLFVPHQIGIAVDAAHKGDINSVNYTILIGLVVSVLIIGVIEAYIATYLAELLAKDFRKDLMRKITDQPYQYINKVGSNELLTIATSDVNNTKQVFSQGLIQIVSALLLFIGVCIIMFASNWVLGLIALATLPFIFGLFYYVFVVKKASEVFMKMQKIVGQMTRNINETVFGASLIRVLNSGKIENKKFARPNEEITELGYKNIAMFSLLFPGIVFIMSIGTVLLLYFGGKQIIEGHFTVGGLTAFLTYYALFGMPIFVLGFGSQSLARGFVSLNRIQGVLDAPEEKNNGEQTATVTGEVVVKNLNFEKNGKFVLKDVSFVIQPKTRTAILGPTGAGKTQLFNIMTGLLEPTSGEIFYSGIPISQWNKDSLLTQVGLVFQDSIIFNTTIKANVMFDASITEDQFKKALHVSNVDEFVAKLPEQENTVISERGGDLSGGQKQRLMLARALAINPKLLLLDDFTARVDSKTEKLIRERLDSEYPNITVVSITQNIEAIKDFDQIIVLEEGEIVGTGTHAQLLKECSEYQQIWKSQQTV